MDTVIILQLMAFRYMWSTTPQCLFMHRRTCSPAFTVWQPQMARATSLSLLPPWSLTCKGHQQYSHCKLNLIKRYLAHYLLFSLCVYVSYYHTLCGTSPFYQHLNSKPWLGEVPFMICTFCCRYVKWRQSRLGQPKWCITFHPGTTEVVHGRE